MSKFTEWKDNFSLNISDIQMEVLEGLVARNTREVLDSLYSETPDLAKTFPIASNQSEDELQGYMNGYKIAWQEAQELINDFRFGLKGIKK